MRSKGFEYRIVKRTNGNGLVKYKAEYSETLYLWYIFKRKQNWFEMNCSGYSLGLGSLTTAKEVIEAHKRETVFKYEIIKA